VNVDNDTLRRILDNPEAMAAVERIEGWRSLGDNIIETIINKSEKVKELKNKAKNKDLTAQQKEQLTEEEKEYKSKRKLVQEKLIKFATRIPAFMYLTDFRENTLQDVITKLEPDLFLAVTGLTVKDFHLLVRLKVFNTEQMNQAVFAFRRYEDASLRPRRINPSSPGSSLNLGPRRRGGLSRATGRTLGGLDGSAVVTTDQMADTSARYCSYERADHWNNHGAGGRDPNRYYRGNRRSAEGARANAFGLRSYSAADYGAHGLKSYLGSFRALVTQYNGCKHQHQCHKIYRTGRFEVGVVSPNHYAGSVHRSRDCNANKTPAKHRMLTKLLPKIIHRHAD
jgi:hypothetical protein